MKPPSQLHAIVLMVADTHRVSAPGTPGFGLR